MGGILETFFILFKTNSDQVKKGQQEAEDSGKKLENQLNRTDAAVTQVGHSFLNMAYEAAGAITAAISVGAALSAFDNAQKMADGLGKVADALGVNVEELSAWDDAVVDAGGHAGDFQNDLKGMNADFTSLATTGHSRLLPFLQQLGVHITGTNGKVRDVMSILPELADSFEKMSKQKASAFGERLGLSEGTILLLQQGRRAVEEVLAKQRELGVVTEEQVKVAKKYNDTVNDTAHAYRTLNLTLATELLPGMSSFQVAVRSVLEFLTKHKDVVIGALVGIAGAAAGAAIAFGVLTSPIVIAAAAVAGLVVVLGFLYDDIKGFTEGKDSLTGRLLAWANNFSVLRAAISGIKDVLKELGEWFTWLWDKAKPVMDAMGKIGVGMVKGFVDRTLGYDGGGIAAAQQQINAASNTGLSARSSGAILAGASTSNRVANVSIGEVNVKTQATDAAGIANDMGLTLKNQMSHTVNQYDDGVQG